MPKDDYSWMKEVKGGKRESAYSEKKPEQRKKETLLERWRREAAEFQMLMIDRYTQ